MIAADKIALFGAGIDGRRALDYFGSERVLFFIDNSSSKIGKKISGKDIISFDDFVQRGCDCKVVITVDIRFIHAVARQLEDHGFDDYISFYEIRNGLRKSDLLYLMYKENDLDARFSWLLGRCDITDLKPVSGYLRKKQLDILDFCKRFFEDFAELNIHPFINGGTLIGALRHGGFVPWDDDMDFGIMRDEFDKLIEFAKKNCIVKIKAGKQSEYDNDAHMSWMDKLLREYPEQYVFVIETELLQVNFGTSCIDRVSFDFFPFDYYNDDYKPEEHKEYIKRVLAKIHEIDYVDKTVDYLKEERMNNPNISDHPTDKIYFGLDYPIEHAGRAERISYFLKREDVFPLRKIRFEDTSFYAPNNPESLSELEYPGFMSYPGDVGTTSHLMFKEKYMSFYMPSADFYINSPEDIASFKPLYDFFEHNGVYSRFLVIKKGYTGKDDNSVLVDTLENRKVRYYTSMYSDSDCVLFLYSEDDSFDCKYRIKLNEEVRERSGMEEIRKKVVERWKMKHNILVFDD